MSKYFYFKSRPGVIWVYLRERQRWIRTRVFTRIEPTNQGEG